MTEDYLKALFSWNYFCSLCDMLKDTMNYIDHSDKKNMKVYSFEFKKIIILTAIEFENIGKCICKDANLTTDPRRYTIIEITEKLTTRYKKMKTIKVGNDYNMFQPLKGWGIERNQSNQKALKGLKWWPKYNEIKHQSYESISNANLSNAINALASLMILEIYYNRILTGNSQIMTNKPCSYFLNPYQNDVLCCEDKKLPDVI